MPACALPDRPIEPELFNSSGSAQHPPRLELRHTGCTYALNGIRIEHAACMGVTLKERTPHLKARVYKARTTVARLGHTGNQECPNAAKATLPYYPIERAVVRAPALADSKHSGMEPRYRGGREYNAGGVAGDAQA